MKNLDRVYRAVPQSRAKGISAVEIAKQTGIHRATVHSYLNTLELMEKVESQHGTWHAKTGEQTIKPSEKEIVITLPMPKGEWHRMAVLEAQAKRFERLELPEIAEAIGIFLEKFRETRILRIEGKNVDNLDLERIGNLIQQANEKGSKVNLRGLFKNLKRKKPKKTEQTDTHNVSPPSRHFPERK